MTVPRAWRLGSAIMCALCVFTATTRIDAQQHRIVRVAPPEMINPAEVSVAIHPTDPDNLVAVAFTSSSGRGVVQNYRFVSQDGGQTWQVQEAPNDPPRNQADDLLCTDLEGRFFHCYISFLGLYGRLARGATNGIFVGSSADGGQQWNAPVAVVDHLNSITPFEDKPSLTADSNPDSANAGNVYIAWTRFDEYQSRHPDDQSHIYFSRSTDHAKSFAPPHRISDVGGDCLDGDGTLMGVTPVVGVDGQVLVFWAGPRGLEVDRSTDGGKTFGTDQVVVDTPGGWDIDVEGLVRHNGLPAADVDRSQGAYRGSIYVTWVDTRNEDPDAFIAFSRDGGATWSRPLRVNDDPPRNGKPQFFANLAVDPSDGSVNVVFYDRRNLDGTRTSLVLARSEDGGQTFRNIPIDIEPFACNPRVFLGDYIAIDAANGRVVTVFPHFIGPASTTLSAAIFDFNEQ